MVDLATNLDPVCLKQLEILRDEDAESALRAALGIEVAIVVVMFYGVGKSRSSLKVDAPHFGTATFEITTPGNQFGNTSV